MNETKLPWSVPVALTDIPDRGAHFDLVADEETRAQIARLAGLRGLPRLEASFDVARQGSRGLRVAGNVTATAGQTCVVTLDPIENEIREDVNLVFASPHEAGLRDDGTPTENLNIDAPELLAGDIVDLGGIATEFFILALDPYPRKSGATFEPPPAEDAGAHPFAALAALKKQQSGKD